MIKPRCSAEPNLTCYGSESSTQPDQHLPPPITKCVPEPIPLATNSTRSGVVSVLVSIHSDPGGFKPDVQALDLPRLLMCGLS
jgi:hypothetical protein